ncbi:MAG: hypothetical protein U0625_11965 [Phycisphaerales bacterium]
MARTSSSKRSSTAGKSAARSRTAPRKGAARREAGRSADTVHPKVHAKSVAQDIRALVAEVRDLRSMREKYNQLLTEHNGLLGTLRGLSNELADSARTAWNDYRATGGKPGPAAGRSRRRVRTSSADVDAMTAKLLASVPGEWKTKEQICAAAGLDPKTANTAFRRLVMGYMRQGKKVAPVLESNGKRGTDGRYRRAGKGG